MCSLEPIVDLYNAFKDILLFKAFLGQLRVSIEF